MMAETIKVDVEEARLELHRFKSNIDRFEPYTQNFTKNQLNQLELFNADFIEKLKAILYNMADDSGPELLAEIKDYHQQIMTAVTTFETMDTNLSERFEE